MSNLYYDYLDKLEPAEDLILKLRERINELETKNKELTITIKCLEMQLCNLKLNSYIAITKILNLKGETK